MVLSTIHALAHLILTNSEVHTIIIVILPTGHWRIKRLSNLPKVPKLPSSRGKIRSR